MLDVVRWMMLYVSVHVGGCVGMNLNVMAAWLMYVMCHVVRKNDARPARFLVQEHDFAKKDVKDNDEDRNIVDDVQSEAESLVRIGV